MDNTRPPGDSYDMLCITYRELTPDEAARVGEIDRTEEVRVGYRVDAGRLICMDVVWDSSPWRMEGDEHSVPGMTRFLETVLLHGGRMMGALDGDRLVGLAAFRPRLTETMGELAFLHVSNGYRRQGIASVLFDRVVEWAYESGARQLYVSATPSESAVGFYTRQGFSLASTPHPERFAQEPDDIHMIKQL